MIDEISRRIDELREDMVSSMMEMIPLGGIGPENGGDGEIRKAEFIERLARGMGLHVERVDAEDSRVPSGIRPNIIVRYEGRSGRNIWIVSHMDVVPPGEGWSSDPFKPIIKEGKIYGRGTEDDGQAIISSLYAVKALADLKVRADYGLNLAIVSDEETGSRYGILHLISEGIFSKEDLILVPDAGNKDGTMIEVAEKGILWIRVTVRGKQAHASTPEKGLNAHRIGMKLALAIDDALHSKFNEVDELFDPPVSTFEPTKREGGVENVNTVPGTDIVYFDCRILPRYDIDEVLETAKKIAKAFEVYGADITVEEVERSEPSFTDPESEIVRRIKRAVKLLRGKEAKPMGIGGGTCAAYLRRAGLRAVVWMTTEETAHQPDEYCVIDNMVEDAKVMASLVLDEL
jgi:succinyl-diaminopimelate desuccinylase